VVTSECRALVTVSAAAELFPGEGYYIPRTPGKSHDKENVADQRDMRESDPVDEPRPAESQGVTSTCGEYAALFEKKQTMQKTMQKALILSAR
jgi:hypothetical protein